MVDWSYTKPRWFLGETPEASGRDESLVKAAGLGDGDRSSWSVKAKATGSLSCSHGWNQGLGREGNRGHEYPGPKQEVIVVIVGLDLKKPKQNIGFVNNLRAEVCCLSIRPLLSAATQ